MNDQVSPQVSTRKHGPRNSHPCDFCRYKRAACLLHGTPPCELCRRQGKECTFVTAPNKRRQTREHRRGHSKTPSITGTTSPSSLGSGSPGDQVDSSQPTAGAASPISPHMRRPSSVLYHQQPQQQLPLSPLSLDATPGYNAQVTGLSGESDPCLFRLFRFDHKNEFPFQQLYIRSMGAAEGLSTHFMLQKNSLASKAQPGDLAGAASDLQAEVTRMVPDEVGKRLISL